MNTLKQLIPALILSFNCFGLGWFAGRLYEIDRAKPSGPDFVGPAKLWENVPTNWSTNSYWRTNQ